MRKTLTAALVATAIGSASLAAPAYAGGSLSFTYTPTNAQDAQTLQTGLALYSLFGGLKKGATIRQYGLNNLAGIGQYGYGNSGLIYQDGTGHAATLNQYGNNNSYGIFQFGKNTNANVSQYGYGQTGATFQFGW
jgi:major curlin subunit